MLFGTVQDEGEQKWNRNRLKQVRGECREERESIAPILAKDKAR